MLLDLFLQLLEFFIFFKLNYDNVAVLSEGLLILTTYNDLLQWGLR